MTPERVGPVFIGGTGRSGTTVLVRILERHPRIHALKWETQFMVAPTGLITLIDEGCDEGALRAFVGRLRGRWYQRTVNPGKPSQYEAGLVSDVTRDELEGLL